MTTASRLKTAVIVMPLVAIAGAVTGGLQAAWLPALMTVILAGRLTQDHYAPRRSLRHVITAVSILLTLTAIALSLDSAYRIDVTTWTAYATGALILFTLPPLPYRTLWTQFLGRHTPPA